MAEIKLSTIDETIQELHAELDSLGSDDERLTGVLPRHAATLHLKYTQTLAVDDLNKAIQAYGDMLARPLEYQNRHILSFKYALLLKAKCDESKLAPDFDDAIKGTRNAIALQAPDDPERAILVGMLADHAAKKYQASRKSADLDVALVAAQDFIETCQSDPAARAAALYIYADLINEKVQGNGGIAYLEQSINHLRAAVHLAPHDHHQRPLILSSLGSRLGQKYKVGGSVEDLQDSIEFSTEAEKVTAAGHPQRALILNNLGLLLSSRHARVGSVDDLDKGISLIQEAAESSQVRNPDDPDLPMFWNNLGLLYEHRYARIGEMADLEESARRLKDAVKATPRDDENLPMRLNNLGLAQCHMHLRTNDIGRLYDAIWATREAVRVAPPTHPDLPLFLSNLSRLHLDFAERTGSLHDGDLAMKYIQAAVDRARSQNPAHPDLAMFLNNLGMAQLEKNRVSQSPNDLHSAIQSLEDALDATPADHPDRAARLSNLGWLLLKPQKGRDGLPHKAVPRFQEALSLNSSPAIDRIEAGRGVLQCCLRTGDWDQAYVAMDKTIRLIPSLAPKSLRNTDKQHVMGQVVGLASATAAVALEAGKGPMAALELLELGRGVIVTALEDVRTDEIASLWDREPSLARRFVAVRNELDFPAWNAGTAAAKDGQPNRWQAEASRRRETTRNFETLVEEIRQIPAFRRFLLPPIAEDLQAAAKQGPIVLVNVSKIVDRCDAFLIEEHQIRVLPLPNLCYEEAERNSRKEDLGHMGILEWLWDAVAQPVLEALGFTQTPSDCNWPHIWWIPTGPLTRLPLHAAGYYQKGSTNTVLDRAMSSYASSIRSIISGRRRRGPQQAPEDGLRTQRAVLVRMDSTPGYDSLPFVADEIAFVQGWLKSVAVPFAQLSGRKPDILSNLLNCTLFHFAGHGHTDEGDPLQSCLLTLAAASDGMGAATAATAGRLTVADLLDLNLRAKAPFLAYLSACGTSQIKKDALLDENVHLVSACQLAGFRHVVGTLWEVQDRSCAEVARVVYGAMRDGGMTDASVCAGLHLASRAMRDRWAAAATDPARMTPRAEKEAVGGEEVSERGGATAVAVAPGQLGERQARKDEAAPRDGKLLVVPAWKAREDKPMEKALWVPYVHYGV